MDSANKISAVLELEHIKLWATDKEKEAIEYAQSALRKESSEYEYREVRSFHSSSSVSDSSLDTYLKAGYEFVRASEYVPPHGNSVGYIEYILRRKKRDDDD